MGFFERLRGASASAAHDEWEEEVRSAHEVLQIVANWRNFVDEGRDCPILLRPGEEALLVLHGGSLVETRSSPVTYRGGGFGASFSIGRGTRLGMHNFESRPSGGAEEQTVIDQGLFVATDRRGVFVGQRQVREFPWEKLLAVQLGVLTRKSLVLYLPVSNRQKVSGIAGDWNAMLDVPTFVQLGVGLAQEGESRLLARLRDELADLYANEPPRSP
jgi:hypothetical protein